VPSVPLRSPLMRICPCEHLRRTRAIHMVFFHASTDFRRNQNCSEIQLVASDQRGPTYFFTSQLGSWQADGKGGVVGKTIDFDYPPNADVARIDYSIRFDPVLNQASGTETLTTFPLQKNPFGGGGTVPGTYTFTGQLVKP
jgi:hypothetical protein